MYGITQILNKKTQGSIMVLFDVGEKPFLLISTEKQMRLKIDIFVVLVLWSQKEK